MKKIIALLMTCLMAVSLAACSYSIHDKEKKEESGTENIQEADTEAAAETAAAEEAGTETAAAEEAGTETAKSGIAFGIQSDTSAPSSSCCRI